MLLLRARLQEQGLLSPQVNVYLEELAGVPAPHLDQLMAYLELLRDRASRERLSALSTRIESYARQQQGGIPMADFLADALQELLDIQKQRVRGRLTPVSELVQGLVSEAQHRPPGQKILLGYSVTPFERLNEVLSGLRPGFYYGLAGAPRRGKTNLALQLASSVANNHHIPVLFYSWEQTQRVLTARLVGKESGLNPTSLLTEDIASRSGALAQGLAGILRYGRELFVLEGTRHDTVDRIRATAYNLMHEFRTDSVTIFLDYLQKVPLANPPNDARARIDEISTGLADLSLELHCPVFAISALDKEGCRLDDEPTGEDRFDEMLIRPRPTMHNCTGSGDIEYDLDVAMVLCKDWKATKDLEELLKNKAGPGGPAPKIDVIDLYLDKNRDAPQEASQAIQYAFFVYENRFVELDYKSEEEYKGQFRGFARIQELFAFLHSQGHLRIASSVPPGPRFGSIHSIRTTLAFVDSALEELKPKYMRGYGRVAESAIPELNGIVSELQGVVQKLNGYLAQGFGQDLQGRLERLDRTGDEIALLKALEAMISEHGLVEFRPALSILLDRLEGNSFEIALFGRVSSGKSSLLNCLLGTQALPVGVNPITAVPTRIAYGSEPALSVWFAERKPQQMDISRLAEFVAEHHNWGNSKHVSRIMVHLPSARLRQGVVFVDTPGLGSLATSGAAETLAYLPRCDLGGVLIDASSTLTQEDLSTIQALYQAAVPAFVLLSKADLLAPEDRACASEYIAEHIWSELGLNLAVHPVSVVKEQAELLDHWFEHEILPLYDRHQELLRQSLRRKIGSLCESIQAALRVRLERASGEPKGPDQTAKQAETALRRAAGRFEEARKLCEEIAEKIGEMSAGALSRVAEAVVEQLLGKAGHGGTLAGVVISTLTQAAAEETKPLYETVAKLSRILVKALAQTAKTLDLRDAPTEQELIAGLQEMPRPDLGKLQINLRPALPFALGKRLARRRVLGQLEQQAGEAVDKAFRSYGRLLGTWSECTLRELQRRFDAHADAYRARLERLAGHDSLSREALEAVRRDLEKLADRPAAAEMAPAPSSTN